jgi:hypothetical protein
VDRLAFPWADARAAAQALRSLDRNPAEGEGFTEGRRFDFQMGAHALNILAVEQEQGSSSRPSSFGFWQMKASEQGRIEPVELDHALVAAQSMIENGEFPVVVRIEPHAGRRRSLRAVDLY